MLKEVLVRFSVVAFVCCLSVSAHAMADQKSQVNVPAGDLTAGLAMLAKQSGAEFVYRADQLKGIRTQGVQGDLSPKEAVTKLLIGTPLQLRMDPSGAMLITPAHTNTTSDVSAAAGSDQTQEGKKDSSGQFLLAQATSGQSSSDVSVKPNNEAKKNKDEELQVVVVTGSRIPTVSGAQTVPVQTYTREEIEQSGQTTLADFFNALPDVSVQSSEDGRSSNYGGKTSVQLHGLPVGTTLLLINGRRVEAGPSGDTSGASYFDLNNIPLSAVERVEVVPVGASAIYGADALGGAVNIILRTKVNGLEVDGKFGHAEGVNDTTANFNWGRSWDRGSVSLIGTYQDRGDLLGSERALTSSANFPTNAPTALYVTDACSPGEVYSLNGQNLPGLSSSHAGIPPGVTGTPTTQQFLTTAGKLNSCSSLLDSSFAPQTQRGGVVASANYQVAESINLFTETLFSQEHLQYGFQRQIQASGGSTGATTLSATNPYNPFGEPVGVSFTYAGYRTAATESGNFVRPLLGVDGSLFEKWHFEVNAYLARDRFEADFAFPNTVPLQAALDSSDPSTALNPFTTGAPASAQILQSIASAATDFQVSFVNQLLGSSTLLRGPLFDLPAGPLEVAVGGEYGQEKEITDNSSRSLALYTQSSLSRHSYAAFAEARVPIFADRASSQAVERLSFTLAGRFDHSNDFGGKVTWQGGFLWRPVDVISLTGSYGVSYQAPNLDEIAGAQFSGFINNLATDPFRGNQSVSALLVDGSNPNLRPETGQARTLGILYSGAPANGIRAALNWFDIDISNYIGTPDLQTVIDNPNLYPGAVVRGSPTAQDVAQGFPGQITQINDLYYNFGDLEVRGFDVDVRYTVNARLGQVTPSVAIANIYKWESALAPELPATSYVSQAGGNPGWAPRWKGTAAIAWKIDALSLNLAGRYTGRYRDYQIYVPNANELGNFWIVDSNLRWDIGRPMAYIGRGLPDAYVALGAVNLFDKKPPFSYGPLPYDDSQYDLRGRFVYAQVGLKW